MSACVFGGSTKRNMKTLCVLCALEGPMGVGGEKYLKTIILTLKTLL
jgi:hypothetical protein